MEARREMNEGKIHTRDDGREIFLKICEKIGPVFRFFFYENFHQPSLYHERISSYTQSLAQWSVGMLSDAFKGGRETSYRKKNFFEKRKKCLKR